MISRRKETDQLERKLMSIGRTMRRQTFYRGVISLIYFSLVGTVALYFLDYVTRIPFPVRLVILGGAIGYGFYWFNRTFLRESRKPVNAQQVSLIIESRYPELQSRMISTLQFQEQSEFGSGVSENLVEGMIDQTFDRLRTFRLADVIDRKWAKRQTIILMASIFLLLSAVSLSPRFFMSFLFRLAIPGIEYPTRTKINVVEIPDPLPAGDPFVMRVYGGGSLPELGKVTIIDDAGEKAEFDLNQEAQHHIYSAKMPSLNGETSIQVDLGDARWSRTIVPEVRPFVKSIEVQVKSPDYAERPVKVEKTGNLRVLQGSKLEFRLQASKKLNSLKLVGRQKSMELPEMIEKDNNLYVGVIEEANTTFGFTIEMEDTLKLKGKNMPQYRISVVADRAPQIRIMDPPKNWEAAPLSQVPLRFEIKDDFKISRIQILYEVLDAEEFADALANGRDLRTETRTYSELADVNNSRYAFDGVWENSRVNTRAGELIRFWLVATDNHQPEPLVTKSEEYMIRVISAAEYRNFLLQKFGEHTEHIEDAIINIKESARQLDKTSKELK